MALLAAMVCTAAASCAAEPAAAPFMAREYLDLAATYAVHARTIWHETPTGGYWGGGIDEKDGNGAVRGMCNTMLGYSLLVHAMDRGWLEDAPRQRLERAGLDRGRLLEYVRANLRHITTHHVSNTSAPLPRWGQSWQSSLWVGAAAAAVLLVDKDIPSDLAGAAVAMATVEADRIAATPPGDYRPGNTCAEENGWNTHALAAAIAMAPNHPNVPTWWKALKSYTLNTHSVSADRTSTRTVGEDTVASLVTTANLFDDYSLENHGFFHPSYVKVSGQEIGEAWLLLALGDERHGTGWAARYEPYAAHNIGQVWRRVMRPLVQPSGEFLYPNGCDWTFHCSTCQAYFAWAAAVTGDPMAVAAQQRGIRGALDRRRASPPGRILGDSNLKWWWEPLVVKRNATALLINERRPPTAAPATGGDIDEGAWTTHLPEAKVWLHRNAHYSVTLAWGKRKMATFTPAGRFQADRPYWTLPIDDGILPAGVIDVESSATLSGGVESVVLRLDGGGYCVLVCLPHSVVWLGSRAFRPIGIENDLLTSPGRTIAWQAGRRAFRPLEPADPVTSAGQWMRVDDGLAFVCDAPGFGYEPAGRLNRTSAAIDRLVPPPDARVWQMLAGEQARDPEGVAADMAAQANAGMLAATVRDGAQGTGYRIELKTDGGKPAVDVQQVKR